MGGKTFVTRKSTKRKASNPTWTSKRRCELKDDTPVQANLATKHGLSVSAELQLKHLLLKTFNDHMPLNYCIHFNPFHLALDQI